MSLFNDKWLYVLSYLRVATMEVKEDFFMYRSGVYRYSSPPQPATASTQRSGYHSIRVIGYVNTANFHRSNKLNQGWDTQADTPKKLT